MTNVKLVSLACFALALTAGATAGVPEIDSPRGDAAATRGPSGTSTPVEGSGPVDGKGSEEPVRGSAGPPAAGSSALSGARELCDRLAGVEREICLKQARENSERANMPGIGATPGRGGGNTGVEQREPPERR